MELKHISLSELEQLKADHPELVVHDRIDLAVDELFDIAYPAKKDSKTADEVQAYAETLTGGRPDDWGEWIYYPWLNQVVHVPPRAEFRALRTSRNRNLVTSEEQTKLYEASILVVGMSVGSNVVEALVSQGIGDTLILVDMDIIEPSNLNRIRSPYHAVGLHKVEAITRKVAEIDPYINVVEYRDGLNEENLQEIIAAHAPDIIVDEMDELRMKVILRETAKAHRLPVIMAADDGDNALLDIERYDLNPDTDIFNGRIPADIIEKIKSQPLPRPVLGLMIGKYFVEPDNIPLRMYQSLAEVGKSLPSWPQLGGAAALSGVSLAYVAKNILLGHDLKDGRILISLDDNLGREHLEEAHRQELQHFQDGLRSQEL